MPISPESKKEMKLKDLVKDRPDLVEKIKAGEDEGSVTSQVEKDVHNRTKKWAEEQKDLDGILISTREDIYTYYDTGEIDTIEMKVLDGSGLEISKKVVKHFRDGRQPVVE